MNTGGLSSGSRGADWSRFHLLSTYCLLEAIWALVHLIFITVLHNKYSISNYIIGKITRKMKQFPQTTQIANGTPGIKILLYLS